MNIIQLPKNELECYSFYQKGPNMHKKFQEALVKKYKQYQCYIPFVVDDMQLQGGSFYLIRVKVAKSKPKK